MDRMNGTQNPHVLTLGTAKLCITPPHPVRLSGYAFRTEPFLGVAEDIFLRVHVLENCGTTLVFFYADLLWWNSGFVEHARAELKNQCALKKNALFFVASHNHSGPPTGDCFIEQLETFDAPYADFLLSAVCQGYKKALANCEPVEMRLRDGTSRLNVFRRVPVAGQYLMRPNYAVDADNSLTIIGFYRTDGTLKGAQIHYACHANVSNENLIQPDFPGIALRRMDETFPSSISLFLQGCTGDLRPNCTLGDRFTPFGYEKTVQFAEFFYQDCLAVLQRTARIITPCLSADITAFDLPLDGVMSASESRAVLANHSLSSILPASVEEARVQHARRVLEKNCRPYETAEIAKIVFGDGLVLYTINAEISQYYASFAREITANALFAAYTNGMIGYVCTAEQIAQGGYEPEGSALYFGLAGTFSPYIEEKIRTELRNI